MPEYLSKQTRNDLKDTPEISPSKKTKKRKLFETFTKAWVSILLIVAMFDLQLSYYLAYLGREEIAETLSVAVVTEIIGVSAVYMIRAYFDTKSEKALNFEKHRFEIENLSVSPEEDNITESLDETIFNQTDNGLEPVG